MEEEDYCVTEGGNLESTQLEELRYVDRRISWLYLPCSIQFDVSTYKRPAQTSKLRVLSPLLDWPSLLTLLLISASILWILQPLIISPNLNNYQVMYTPLLQCSRTNNFPSFQSSSTHYLAIKISPPAVERYTYLCLHLLLLQSTLCMWHFIFLKGNIVLSLS